MANTIKQDGGLHGFEAISDFSDLISTNCGESAGWESSISITGEDNKIQIPSWFVNRINEAFRMLPDCKNPILTTCSIEDYKKAFNAALNWFGNTPAKSDITIEKIKACGTILEPLAAFFLALVMARPAVSESADLKDFDEMIEDLRAARELKRILLAIESIK